MSYLTVSSKDKPLNIDLCFYPSALLAQAQVQALCLFLGSNDDIMHRRASGVWSQHRLVLWFTIDLLPAIEKRNDDVTKTKLWNYGIDWHIRKGQGETCPLAKPAKVSIFLAQVIMVTSLISQFLHRLQPLLQQMQCMMAATTTTFHGATPNRVCVLIVTGKTSRLD